MKATRARAAANCRRVYDRAGPRVKPHANRDDARAFFASTTVDDDAYRRLVRLARFVTGGLPARWANVKLRQNRARVAPDCRLAYIDMPTGTDFVDDIRGIDTRYLVIVGDKDPGLNAAAMQAAFLAWHPSARARDDAELRALPHAGMSAVFHDDRRGFPARRGRLSVTHACRPEKAVLAAAAR
ncbi:hypothetical protein [Burkholderia pyrrocinia]|uniref:hypothetical protein n=1 Tax=Burkholderia pyrrocinia TaxID=60550 RepID=UPI00201B8285|nr:hypothetical protein [Burkholderia pyrrocinia]